MVIHTGGDKRKGICAEVTTGAGGKTFTQHDSKDVPRFAEFQRLFAATRRGVPLFRRPKVLSSRFAFLRARVRDRSGKEFSRHLSRAGAGVPFRQIHEAMKRLLDRRFIVPTSRASGGTAADWASLGLSTEAAEKSLQKCRVRIELINVQGAKELATALEALGVRVVKRSADLTVTLVNDYLEERLLELNRKHLSDHSRWLLVQPSGIFPLVGPIFTPARACWNCLADRMARNREVKALLDRSDARCVAASPLARQPLGQSSIQLAAVEIAKAIATDFRTELSDHVVSLDLLGSTIVKHYVAARPQCPACGRKKVRDPRPVPALSACRRRQGGHDQRRLPERFVGGYGRAFPQTRKPAHRRRPASSGSRPTCP